MRTNLQNIFISRTNKVKKQPHHFAVSSFISILSAFNNQIYYTMKTFPLLFFTFSLTICCSGAKKESRTEDTEKERSERVTLPAAPVWYEGEKPIYFNVEENYPETNIRLSDLSDALYIPLETNDTTLLRQRGTCEGNEYLLTNDFIYAQEEQTAIYIFKKDGSLVRKIDHRGGGPGEYSYISSYAVDTLRNEIFVQDANLKKGCTYVYDLEGNFKRTFPNKAKEIVILNDSLLLNYFRYNPGGPRYSVIRKKDGSTVKKLPIRFPTQLPHDSHGRLAYGSLIKSPKGAFMANLGNDTIFEIRQQDLQVVPRIIDQSQYPTTFAQIHPTIESGRYLMFYILRSHSYKPYVDEHFYIYDKKENQIYKMTDYTGNSYWTLMDDYPHITNWNTTQNSHIAVRTRQVYALQEAEGQHGDEELKKLIETLDDDANPVLQIMIFHDVDQVKK